MHDGGHGTVVILDGSGTRVGEIGLFFYGEGIHVCAEERGRNLSVAEDAGDAVASNVRVDFII